MESIVKQRIKEVLSFYKVSPNKLSNSNSATQRRYSRQIVGDSSLTCNTILEILDAFGSVSAEWLLRGEGSMLQSEDSKAASDTQEDVGYWRDRCMNAEREAERLRGIIEGLRMAMGINTSVQDSSSKVVG